MGKKLEAFKERMEVELERAIALKHFKKNKSYSKLSTDNTDIKLSISSHVNVMPKGCFQVFGWKVKKMIMKLKALL